MMPDRSTLQNLKKKSNESFRLYAQRWREITVQVQPPLLEKEMTMIFINTLKAPFITHMLGSASKNFSDIIMNSEMIEHDIKSGRIDGGENNRRSAPKKRENEVNNVNAYSKSITVSQPRKVVANQQGSSKQEAGVRQNTEKPQFTPIPMLYKELYQNLFNAHVVSPHSLTPLRPPYPKWYDINAQCDYHEGISWRSIENYIAFKKLVERLISMGVVKFEDSSNAENLLPNHTDKGVNMMSGNMGEGVKTNIAEVKTPLKWVWKERARRGLVLSGPEKGWENGNYCEFHHETGHEIERCEEFRALVQSMMDNKEMKFYEETEEEKSICASESMTKISKKIISWSLSRALRIMKLGFRNGSYTHNGKRYDTQAEFPREKTLMVEQRKGKAVGSEPLVNEPIKEEEAKEFWKFLKHSEYSVVGQLYKQPARISVLALLLSSEMHRSRDSTKALYITTRCKGYTLLGVLIDNGSALNVLPLSTLDRLPVDSSHMKTCQSIVRAFDGTEMRVMGRIEIPLMIGPTTYEVDFLKVKLVSEGRLVTISAEEDIIATVTGDAPYVETKDEVVECSFRSLEFVNATFIAEGNRIPVPKISKTTEMGLQLTIGRGASPGKGLGKHL
ncbi:uncharacterized protein [Gossypium hirsutum]|uniref:Gag-pro-like protein n=1 Tax=Gossypium hirsutum TaxID=3635 RepID=A0A1U8KSX8_GOSHI|nr:uncharacterized protein LOC107919084 [Gossypium hirsutum]